MFYKSCEEIHVVQLFDSKFRHKVNSIEIKLWSNKIKRNQNTLTTSSVNFNQFRNRVLFYVVDRKLFTTDNGTFSQVLNI